MATETTTFTSRSEFQSKCHLVCEAPPALCSFQHQQGPVEDFSPPGQVLSPTASLCGTSAISTELRQVTSPSKSVLPRCSF